MTTALRAKKALVHAISQRPEFRNRQVSISHPGSDLETEAIFLNGVRSTELARHMGKAHRRETLIVEVAVVCEVLGNDLEEVEERAWAMVEGVENAVAEDSSLGGLALMCEVDGFEQRNFTGPEKSVIEVTVEVRIVADKDFES